MEKKTAIEKIKGAFQYTGSSLKLFGKVYAIYTAIYVVSYGACLFFEWLFSHRND